jgi:AGCS family alanine or glycine:cation symporter
VSFIHARSLAEDIKVSKSGEKYTGVLKIVDGNIQTEDIALDGKSLLHSAPLTTAAFQKGLLGNFGKYIVSIGLLLFAFSTAISWSYYGDRAMTFLFGSGSIVYYRVVYVLGFFVASFMDTTIVWTFSGIAIALMTIPNLIGILVLHKDVKQTITEYWRNFKG